MKIDFTACAVTGGIGLRSRIEGARELYSPASADYFDDILSKRRNAFCDSACGFLLLDSLLQKNAVNRSELAVVLDANGRPRAGRGGLDFSVSHSEGCAVCVLALGENANVGCDVQHERGYSAEKLTELAGAFMSGSELAEFRRSERKTADFFMAWTRREAYVKRVGSDIFDNLKTADLSGERFREGVILACGERYYYSINAEFDDEADAEKEDDK